jgi:flagellar basal-body rod protein FlgG
MMDKALFAAASGMAAQQENLDRISDNLANADVTGFKGSAQEFAELAAPGEPGIGTVALGSHVVLSQGKLEKSNGPFDMGIDGEGFFVIERGNHRAYTRDGEFLRSSDGTLRNAQGWSLAGVRLPPDALRAEVESNGAVSIVTPTGAKIIAHVRLAIFPAPEHLRSLGGTMFTATSQSGLAHEIAPGSDDGPKVRFGMLERSNVSIIESMMQILTAQRAYEANAKGIQAADEMLRIANNLQRD